MFAPITNAVAVTLNIIQNRVAKYFTPLMVTLDCVEKGHLEVVYDLLYTNRQCSLIKTA